MKHHLSSFRRSTALRVFCILILTVMCAPMAMAASITPAGPTLATVGGFNSLMIAGVVGGLGCVGLMNKAGEEGGENGGGGAKADDKPVDVAEALAALEDKTLPLSQRLRVAGNALRGIPPTDQYNKVTADLATAQAALKTKEKELSDAQARITALEADAAENEKTITTLGQENKDLKAKEQDLDKRASEQAKQITRSVGIDAGKLPGAMAEGQQAETPAQVAYAAFSKEKDPDKKAELFRAYKDVAAKEKKAAA